MRKKLNNYLHIFGYLMKVWYNYHTSSVSGAAPALQNIIIIGRGKLIL